MGIIASMADPFSIITGTAGLADVSIRLAKFLKQAKNGFQTVDDDLEDLSKEIDGLQDVNALVKRTHETGSASNIDVNDQQIFVNQWETIQATLAGCEHIVEQLRSLLSVVLSVGGGKHTKIDKLRKFLKQQSKEEDFNRLRQRLGTHQAALQTSLAAVTM